MKFWIYCIDWKSLAVEVIARCNSEREADAAYDAHIAQMTNEQRLEMVHFRTLAKTTASPEMEEALQQFLRIGGRVPAHAN